MIELSLYSTFQTNVATLTKAWVPEQTAEPYTFTA
jgi:hypothetical protein